MHGAALTGALGDFPERVIGRDLVLIARLRGTDWRGLHWRGRSARWRGRTGRRRRNWQLGRNGCGDLRRIKRRIQQQRVFAQQSATGPEYFNEEVQIGFANRLGRRHPDDTLAVWAQNRREGKVRQKILAIDPCPIEVFDGCQNRDHFPRSQRLGVQQFDFSHQRLIQRGFQRDLTQPQRVSHFGSQRGSSRDCQHQIANPNHCVNPLFFNFSRIFERVL